MIYLSHQKVGLRSKLEARQLWPSGWWRIRRVFVEIVTSALSWYTQFSLLRPLTEPSWNDKKSSKHENEFGCSSFISLTFIHWFNYFAVVLFDPTRGITNPAGRVIQRCSLRQLAFAWLKNVKLKKKQNENKKNVITSPQWQENGNLIKSPVWKQLGRQL